MTELKLMITKLVKYLTEDRSDRQLEDGNSAYKSGDFTSAFKKLKASAENGNVIAQYNIANMFSKGEGVTQDHAKAAGWYRLAAE